MQEVAHDAASQGVRVATGLCYDFETSAPYSPWIDLIRLIGPDNAETTIPDQVAGLIDGAVPQPPALAGELERFFIDIASDRGLMVILEDLQWSDQASLEVLRILARRIRGYPIGIVATYRDTDLQPRTPLYRMLPALIRESRASRITLPRLDRAALDAFIRSRYELTPPDLGRLVNYVARYAEGNPFFCEELLQALEAERILTETRDTVAWKLGDLDTFQMPLLLRQIIDGRLARLTGATRDAMQIAAVIGDEIPLDLWQDLTGLNVEELSDIVDDAMTGGIIEETAGRHHLRFRHALVREALYENLILLRRRVVHKRIGEYLSRDSNPDPDSVAHHYYLAGDARAAGWLIRAARRSIQAASYLAATTKFEEAIAIYQRMNDLAGDYAWLLLEVSEAYRYVDITHALSNLDITLERGREASDSALVTTATWLRGRTRALAGENALDEIDTALAMFESLDLEQRNRIRSSNLGSVVSYGALAPLLAHFGRFRQSIELARQFFELLNAGQIERDPNEISDAYLALALSHAAMGDIDQSRRAYEQSRRRRLETNHLHGVAAAYDWEYVTIDKAYFGDNAELGRTAIRLADEAWLKTDFVQLVEEGVIPHISEGHILLGEWNEARKRAEACLSISVLRSGSTLILAELDRLQGNHETARARIRAAIPYGPDIEPSVWLAHNTMGMMRVAGELALDRQDLERASLWIAAYGRWASWSGGIPGLTTHALLDAQLHITMGRLPAATKSLELALERASSPRQPLVIMNAQRLLGEIAIEQGRLEDAFEHLATARTIAVSADAPFERARCAFVLARLEQARGNRDAATLLAGDALDTANQLGARPLVEVVLEFVESSRKDPATKVTPGGLTPREVDVLRLVARGMTDAEVAGELHISPRTVGRHLSSIYEKLSVNSRTAATAFAYEQGIATG